MRKFIKELTLYSVVVLAAIVALMFFCYNNGAVLPEKILVSCDPLDETYHLKSHDAPSTAEVAELIRGTRVYQLQEKDIFLLPITDILYWRAVGFPLIVMIPGTK